MSAATKETKVFEKLTQKYKKKLLPLFEEFVIDVEKNFCFSCDDVEKCTAEKKMEEDISLFHDVFFAFLVEYYKMDGVLMLKAVKTMFKVLVESIENFIEGIQEGLWELRKEV